MADVTTGVDAQEQLTRMERMNAETRKFVEEGLKLTAEARKLAAEQQKLDAAAMKFGRDRALFPWQLGLPAVAAGTGLFASGAALFKLFGH